MANFVLKFVIGRNAKFEIWGDPKTRILARKLYKLVNHGDLQVRWRNETM